MQPIGPPSACPMPAVQPIARERKLRILLLAPHPFFTLRGTPLAVRRTIDVLTGEGHHLDVLTYHLGDDIPLSHGSIHRMPAVPFVHHVRPGFSVKKVICDGMLALAATKLMLRQRYDVIHAVEESAFIAMALGALLRTPYIYDMDSSLAEQLAERYALPGWLRAVLRHAEALAVRRALGVVTCCEALAALARRYAPTVPTVVVEDVSLLSLESSAAPPPNVRWPAGPMVLYVGNLEPYQGVDLLIDAFALARRRVGDAQLLIVGGDATQIRRYRERAVQRGVDEAVHWVGARPIEQLGGFLARATLVVSPRLQGCNTPMKVYSYLDSGRPLLATRLPMHTQVLDETVAHLVAPRPDAMAAGMVRLLGDAGYRERLAAAARQRVRTRHHPRHFAARLLGFYQALAGELAARRHGVRPYAAGR